ncbi:MAG TPA: helix-turn-helix transcriptional regulator [Polyangiales bacterium]|nr:helix-turn-helix transcriptional regulator [Polyangiales bacterium]
MKASRTAQALALDFADQVRALMAERGLTHADLADLLGGHRAIVSRVLRGEHMPSLDTMLQYARALDCDLVLELSPLEILLVPRSAAPSEAA